MLSALTLTLGKPVFIPDSVGQFFPGGRESTGLAVLQAPSHFFSFRIEISCQILKEESLPLLYKGKKKEKKKGMHSQI